MELQKKDSRGYTDTDGSLQEHHQAISGYAFLVNGGAMYFLILQETKSDHSIYSKIRIRRSNICC